MKEFAVTIKDTFKAGLRRFENLPKNILHLVECFNMKPKEYGLIPFVPITNPFTSTTVSPPFPQIIKGKNVTLLCDATAIYSVNETTWALTQLTTYDAFSVTTPKAITTGGPWHFSDFHNTWFLYNGNCIVFQANKNPGVTLVVDSITITTGCSYRGRGITAGFDKDDYWLADWTTLWNNWINQLPSEAAITASLNNIGQNFVWWSSIGGGDLLWQFYPSLAEQGSVAGAAHTSALPLLMDMMKRNEAGFMPMPWQGTVRMVKPLDAAKSVIVYGDDGISAITFQGGQVGLKHLLNVGVMSRSSIGGGNDGHIFLDRAGNLWSIDGSLKAERLGFKEYLSGLSTTSTVITYDEVEKEYYICDNSSGFILTDGRLCKISHLVTSISRIAGSTVGLYKDTSDNEARLNTDILDFGERGIKFIEFIELSIETSSSVYVAIDFRFGHSNSFTRSSWVKVNKEGIAHIGVSGTDFKIAIKADSYINTYPSYVTIRWKYMDRRTRRGTNVNQINA